jgi:hypothetical protein
VRKKGKFLIMPGFRKGDDVEFDYTGKSFETPPVTSQFWLAASSRIVAKLRDEKCRQK